MERKWLEGGLNLGAVSVDLSAPVLGGIRSGEVVGAQATLQVDARASKSREPGSDLAIGHA